MKKYDNFSKEELIELLLKQDKELVRKKYGLYWDSEKEPEQVVIDCEKNLPVLKNIIKKDIKTNDDDCNIIIEGDNYHALQVLNYTHKEKIDVIYIDPPYNTGNKDFIYNDKFVDKEDGYRHSKWLNFMEKRLDLAKNLLKDSGVIFISIDDNEQANLKLLCDKIFGEKNFISCVIWQDKYTTTNDKNGISSQTDYILCYSKNLKLIDIKKLPLREEYINKTYTNDDNDGNGKYMTVQMFKKKNPYSYDVCSPNGKIWNKPWNFTKDNFETMCSENKIFWGRNNDSCPRKKVYLKDSKGINPVNFLLGKEVGYSSNGGDEIENLFGDRNYFTYPKPSTLIKFLTKISTNKNSIILDFFAGSGTTGHAVLDLNKEDDGNRKFILCTNNEGEIAEKVCYPRIEKVINGYNKNGNGEWVDGLGGNVKYFKTDFVKNSKNQTQTKINVAKNCSEMLCLKNGIYNKVTESESFNIFENDKKDKFLCIYFDFFNNDIDNFINDIKKLNGKKLIYIFSLDNNVDKNLIKNIKQASIEPIPQKILDLYKKIAKDHIKGENND